MFGSQRKLDFHQNRWRIFSEITVEEIDMENRTLIQKLLLMGAAVALLALGVGIMLSRRIVHSLEQISASAQELSNGNYTIVISRGGPSEIDALSKVLDELRERLLSKIESLKAANIQLDHLNSDLEEQVEQRTAQLKLVMDASEKEKETALEANRSKSIFLANMSHELRTPLSAILGFARLLTRDSGMNKEQQERLDIINRSGEHLLGMVDDILSLSKIEAGRIELKQETFGVTQMLQDVGQMMKSRAEGKGLRFTLELDTALPPNVHGDAGKLRQILINLLGNAVKFTETGEVRLRALATDGG